MSTVNPRGVGGGEISACAIGCIEVRLDTNQGASQGGYFWLAASILACADVGIRVFGCRA